MSSANSVDAGILQRLLGFDSRELEALIKLGVIEKQRSGKFELLPCVRRYVSHLQKVNKGQVDQAFVARHLDMSERNLRDVLRGLGIDWPVDSIDSVRVAYIRDLREKAAGRGGDDQGELTRARTRDALASAKIREIQFFESTGQLVSVEELEPLLEAWATMARSEFINGMNKVIADIEGANDVVVDRVMVDGYARAALDAVGEYPGRAARSGSDNSE